MGSPEDVKQAWQRIEAWFSANAPDYLKRLQPPATPAAIEQAESELKQKLPDDLKVSLQVHNGQNPRAMEIFGTWGLHGLEKAMYSWRKFSGMAEDGTLSTEDSPKIKASPSVRPRQWDHGWLPISPKGSGDHLLLDLDPKDPACRGQVITFSPRSSTRQVVAPGFGAWLEQIAADLESGKWVMDEDGKLHQKGQGD